MTFQISSLLQTPYPTTQSSPEDAVPAFTIITTPPDTIIADIVDQKEYDPTLLKPPTKKVVLGAEQINAYIRKCYVRAIAYENDGKKAKATECYKKAAKFKDSKSLMLLFYIYQRTDWAEYDPVLARQVGMRSKDVLYDEIQMWGNLILAKMDKWAKAKPENAAYQKQYNDFKDVVDGIASYKIGCTLEKDHKYAEALKAYTISARSGFYEGILKSVEIFADAKSFAEKYATKDSGVSTPVELKMKAFSLLDIGIKLFDKKNNDLARVGQFKQLQKDLLAACELLKP